MQYAVVQGMQGHRLYEQMVVTSLLDEFAFSSLLSLRRTNWHPNKNPKTRFVGTMHTLYQVKHDKIDRN